MNYTGMTVNERLYASGLINEYDKAVRKKDVKKIVEILNEIEIGEDNIPPILEFEKLSDSEILGNQSIRV